MDLILIVLGVVLLIAVVVAVTKNDDHKITTKRPTRKCRKCGEDCANILPQLCDNCIFEKQ